MGIATNHIIAVLAYLSIWKSLKILPEPSLPFIEVPALWEHFENDFLFVAKDAKCRKVFMEFEFFRKFIPLLLDCDVKKWEMPSSIICQSHYYVILWSTTIETEETSGQFCNIFKR